LQYWGRGVCPFFPTHFWGGSFYAMRVGAVWSNEPVGTGRGETCGRRCGRGPRLTPSARRRPAPSARENCEQPLVTGTDTEINSETALLQSAAAVRERRALSARECLLMLSLPSGLRASGLGLSHGVQGNTHCQVKWRQSVGGRWGAANRLPSFWASA